MYKVYWFDYKGNWAIAAGLSEEDAVRSCYEEMSSDPVGSEDIEQGIKKFLVFRAEKAKHVEVVSLLEGVSSDKRGCLRWLP